MMIVRNAKCTAYAAYHTPFAYRMPFFSLLWSQAFGPLTFFLSNRLSGLFCALVSVCTYLLPYVLVLSHLFWSWKQVFYKAIHTFRSYSPLITVLVNSFQFILEEYTKTPVRPNKSALEFETIIHIFFSKPISFVRTVNQLRTWIAYDSILIIYCFDFSFNFLQNPIHF